jgi:ABC-type anion transport system duplicated permease subunit
MTAVHVRLLAAAWGVSAAFAAYIWMHDMPESGAVVVLDLRLVEIVALASVMAVFSVASTALRVSLRSRLTSRVAIVAMYPGTFVFAVAVVILAFDVKNHHSFTSPAD